MAAIRTDRMLRAKEALLEKFKKMTPRVDPHHKRLPPGQHLTTQFPVLDLGIRPNFDPAVWRLRIGGQVENPVALTWADFTALPKAEQVSDFHCVTTWSKYDVTWSGVKFRTLVDLVRPKPGVTHLIQECADGYTTNLPLNELRGDDVMLAYELEGRPLPLEHGGPMRFIVPHLYAWKSSKFLIALRFLDHDEKGYWETRGYHNHADPWKEERYG
jgi:DMSO/TMAO reductase YedYZ molybdopterin-dependent catalytic subunit